jgi:methyl-accepting chemotaxis protein
VESVNRWLARLRIAHKLILGGVFFALPIIVLLFYVTREYNRGIRTCEREVAGTKTLEVCPGLLRDLRALEAQEILAGRGIVPQQLETAEIRKRVDNAVGILQRGQGTATKELVGRLGSLWRQIQERGQAMSARDKAALYHQMVEATLQLVPVILDDSTLILDSELHTYYLMNVTGPLLLQAQSALAEAKTVALRASSEGRSLDQRDLSQLHAQSGALLNTIIPRMRYSLETALREDRLRHGEGSSFQKSVPPLFERYVERVSDLSMLISQSVKASNTTLTPEGVASRAAAAEDAGVSLGLSSVKALRSLLTVRVAEDKSSRTIAWLLTLFCVALATAVMASVTWNITRPLNFVEALTRDIATGRVSEAINRQHRGEFKKFLPVDTDGGQARTKDEICKLISSVSVMTENLNALLVKVAQAGTQVAGSASRMSVAIRQVEAAVSEQAASTNQVSVTSKEIDVTGQALARRMAGVTRMAEEASGAARVGVSSLEGIRSALDELIRASAALTQTFNSINEKTGNIDKIITAITKVANRTNLLSLNAAIEAEKEGDKSGGFSVVAVEMRRLADQTAVAALDIEKQIRDVQHAVREGVSSVESYAGQTQAKSVAVTELSSGLGQVIEGTTKLAPEFEAVNKAMQMQSQGAGQIADAMQQLREAANQTKDSLAEFRQVAETLQSAVRDLQGEVGRFTTAA